MSENGSSEPGAGGERQRTASTGSAGSGERERTLSNASSGGDYRRMRTLSSGSVSGLRVVVMAVDASDNAKIAFNWFLENVHRPDDMIVLVHCPEPPKLPSFTFKSGIAPPVHEWKTILDDLNARTRKLEEDYEGSCITQKLRYKVRGETMKKPGEGIVRVCDEEKADLVVIGTRGLSTMARTLLGSVSDYVVRNANCPTIIVPGKKVIAAIARRASESEGTK